MSASHGGGIALEKDPLVLRVRVYQSCWVSWLALTNVLKWVFFFLQEAGGRVMTAKDLLRQLQQIDDLLSEWEFRLYDAVLDKGR